jgi:16S rRNA processing protein RimM
LTAQPERPGEAESSRTEHGHPPADLPPVEHTEDPAANLPAGRIGRAHGLDGSFYVTRPQSRLLTLGAAVLLAGRTAEIVRRSGTEQRPILRLEGIDSRAAVEALRGEELTVARSAAPALADGEWWAHELEGCTVVDGEQLLGTVSRLLVLPSCEALEVRPAQGGEPVLVPMVKDAVRSVAPAQRRIEVNLDFLGLAAHPRSKRDRGNRRERGGCE